MEEQKQLEYISIARGIGIILVVLGHCTPTAINKYIYLFHMPMFFIISGFLFKGQSAKKPLMYIKKKIEKLYIPYITINILFLVLHNIFFEIGFYEAGFNSMEKIVSFQELVKELISICLLIHMELICAPTWFIRVLFVSSIMMMFLFRYVKKEHIIVIVSITGFLLVYLLKWNSLINNSIVIYTCLVLIAIFFMVFGFLWHKYNWFSTYYLSWIFVSAIILFMLGNVGEINIVSLKIENPFYLIIASLLGTYVVYGMSNFVIDDRIKCILKYLGDHTLYILILHCSTFKLVNIFYAHITGDCEALKRIHNGTSVPWVIIYTLVGLCIPVLIETIVRKIRLYIRELGILWKM